MAKLTYYNGRYVEGDYENALIDYPLGAGQVENCKGRN